MVQTAKSGEFPLWNPYLFAGIPAFGTPAACIFYPFTLIFYPAGVAGGFNSYIVLHLVMAACFTYLWMREWGVGTGASVFAGLGYGLSGSMVSVINCPNNLASAIYFPLVLIFYRRMMRSGGVRWTAGVVLAMFLMFLAGDPAVSYATALVLGFHALLKFFNRVMREQIVDLSILGKPFLAFFFLGGLALFQLVPLTEYVRMTTRSQLHYGEATSWSMPIRHLWGLVLPYFGDLDIARLTYYVRQSWIENYYAGIVLMLAALFALTAFRADSRVRRLMLLFGCGVILVLGSSTVFYKLFFYSIPLANTIRYPVRFFFLVSFAGACLGGLGVEILALSKRSAGTRGFIYAAFAISLALVLIYFLPGAAERNFNWLWNHLLQSGGPDPVVASKYLDLMLHAFFSVKRELMFAAFFALAVFICKQRQKLAIALPAVLAALLFIDLASANIGYEPMIKQQDLIRPSKNVEAIAADKGLFRVISSPRLWDGISGYGSPVRVPGFGEAIQTWKDWMVPNLPVLFRIPIFFGYESFLMLEAERMRVGLLYRGATSRVLDMLNLKYVVSPLPPKKVSPNFKLLRSNRAANVYLNTAALPRAFLVPHAVEVDKNGKILNLIFRKDFDPLQTVYLLKGSGPLIELEEGVEGNPSGTADIVRYQNREVWIDVRSDGPQWLFLSDTYMSGWNAQVNGSPVPIYKANGMFRAVRVPAGQSRVRFYYFPVSFFIGGGLTLTFFAVGLVLTLKSFERHPQTDKMKASGQHRERTKAE